MNKVLLMILDGWGIGKHDKLFLIPRLPLWIHCRKNIRMLNY